MDVLEADRAVADHEIGCAVAIANLFADAQEAEHRLHVRQALADFAIDEPDEVERHGELHQHGVDEDEIADRLRSGAHLHRGHDHGDTHAGGEDHALPEVQPAERGPGLCRGLFVARHGPVEAFGLHRLVAEILHRLEVEKRVDRLVLASVSESFISRRMAMRQSLALMVNQP